MSGVPVRRMFRRQIHVRQIVLEQWLFFRIVIRPMSSTGIPLPAITAIFSLWVTRSRPIMRKWNGSWPSRVQPKSLSIRPAIESTQWARTGSAIQRGHRRIARAIRSIKPMQRGNTVIVLEILCLAGDLCRVELDLFRVFFGFDFNEPLNWVFNCFGQVV